MGDTRTIAMRLALLYALAKFLVTFSPCLGGFCVLDRGWRDK